MVKRLTSKEEKFCLAIVAGKNQSDAYREAYAAGNMLPGTIYHRAMEMMQKSHITDRLLALRRPAERGALVDAEKLLDRLQIIIDSDIQQPVKAADVTAAINLKAKIGGLFQPDRKEQHTQITQVTVVLDRGTGARVEEQVLVTSSQVVDPPEAGHMVPEAEAEAAPGTDPDTYI